MKDEISSGYPPDMWNGANARIDFEKRDCGGLLQWSAGLGQLSQKPRGLGSKMLCQIHKRPSRGIRVIGREHGRKSIKGSLPLQPSEFSPAKVLSALTLDRRAFICFLHLPHASQGFGRSDTRKCLCRSATYIESLVTTQIYRSSQAGVIAQTAKRHRTR
jgi:hypothetical protein